MAGPLSHPHPLPSSAAPRTGVERRAVAGALAAELGHDLQGPLNLFRLSTERLARGEALDEEDVSLLQEELDRLSQMSARLRELARASLHKVACSPQELVQLALAGCERAHELTVEVTDSASFSCDLPLLSQALRELVDNALEAQATQAGVRFEAGSTPGFCVWDDGPGFSLSTDSAQAWGVTTRPNAAGLGLTLALRAARAHGFNLELRRAPPHTEAWLLIPNSQLGGPKQEQT